MSTETDTDPEVEAIKEMIDDFQHDFVPRKSRMKVIPTGDLTLVRIEMVLEKPVPDQKALQDRILKLEKTLRQRLQERAIDEALREKPDIIDEHLAWVDRERRRMVTRRVAKVVAVVCLGSAAFTTFLMWAAYRGFYIEFLRPLWYIWPWSGQFADIIKTIVIWLVAVGISAGLLVRSRKVKPSVTEPKGTSQSQT